MEKKNKRMPVKLYKIKIVNKFNVLLGEMHVPKKCDSEFENAIIHFLDILNNHNATKKCCKLWAATYKGRIFYYTHYVSKKFYLRKEVEYKE